jgi:hypothetical protein
MSKTYALEIENIGSDTYILISRGHHDIHEFMRRVRADGYDWPLGEPVHIWMKTRPSRDPGYNCFYDVVPEGTRGAWPATHVHEAWHESAYEAKFPEQAAAIRAQAGGHHD